ncbi:phage minor capsid protein [Blastopirellula marina]|uniref:Phage head morphogenesis domain-containing protein n=1 Tax=Blastopirellula marina TaxID=124 RepID=A0A2S8GSH8_9BACT|nr:hypothetical protein [Blastopirellula marina]PQO47383.1 hypothetical protein C5Y93_04895 [Blastopirellula marina]
MPPRISPADRRLITAYTEAALRIERQLRDVSDPKRRDSIKARIEPILSELEAITAQYLRKDLAAQFKRGSQEAVDTLRKMKEFRGDIKESFTQLHKEALQVLADGAAKSFGVGIRGVRGEVERMISTATKQQIQAEILAADASGSKAAVKDIFEKQGFASFRSDSRTWNLDHYASMITHTILAEAHNTGAATRYAENGVEFVRIIERETAPDACCKWMRGKIVWLGERRLLNPFHPNCFGSFAPYFGDTSQAFRSIDDPRIPKEVRKFLARKS